MTEPYQPGGKQAEQRPQPRSAGLIMGRKARRQQFGPARRRASGERASSPGRANVATAAQHTTNRTNNPRRAVMGTQARGFAMLHNRQPATGQKRNDNSRAGGQDRPQPAPAEGRAAEGPDGLLSLQDISTGPTRRRTAAEKGRTHSTQGEKLSPKG